MASYLIVYQVSICLSQQSQHIVLIEHGHINPKDGALLFLGSGDIGDVVVIPMEYHLCELDSIVVFFEYLMMFNGFHLPYFYLVIDICKG